MSLARALIVVRGYDAEVERSIRAALQRSGEQDDAPERFPVLRSALRQLRDVYNSFTEGHATAELVAARTVLGTPSV
jgi:hypothetical protein